MIKTKIIISLFILSILISSGLTYHFVNASFSGNLEDLPFYVGAPQPYSYLINTNGTHYFAWNGTTGELCWESTNASYVWQTAINEGTEIIVKNGVYVFDTIVTTNKNSLHIKGDGASKSRSSTYSGVIVRSSLMPCFKIDGIGLELNSSIQDIKIENILFDYIGEVTTGNFVEFQGLQYDYRLVGNIKFENMHITSNQTGVPTDNTMVGLWINETVGMTFEGCSFTHFGTGLSMGSVNQGDMTTFINCQFSYCKEGYLKRNGASLSRETWIDCKWLRITNNGMAGTAAVVTMISPQFETMSGTACIYNSGGITLDITGGQFSDFNIGIVYSSISCVVENCYFRNGTAAIWQIESTGNCTLIGNKYGTGADAVTTLVHYDVAPPTGKSVQTLNDGYITYNEGTQTCASGEIIAHGLDSTPTFVSVVSTNATYDGVGVQVSFDWDTTNITPTLTWTNGTTITDDVILLVWKAEG